MPPIPDPTRAKHIAAHETASEEMEAQAADVEDAGPHEIADDNPCSAAASDSEGEDQTRLHEMPATAAMHDAESGSSNHQNQGKRVPKKRSINPAALQEPEQQLLAQPHRRLNVSQNAVPLAIFAALAAGGMLLFGWWRNRGRKGTRNSVTKDASAAPALTGKLHLQPAAAAQPPKAAPALRDLNFAIDDLFTVEGETTEGPDSNGAAAESTAPVLTALQQAGARGVAKAATPELNLGLLGIAGSMPANHLAPGCMTSGAGGACASAVAAGDVDFAIGTDHLAGIRVGAACCGMYGFRASHGMVPMEGVSTVAPSLEAIAFTAAQPARLVQIGQALQLPGSNTHKGEMVRIVIAKDLFAGCDDEMAPAFAALHAASRQWAGEDQVNEVPLCAFLADMMPSLAKFQISSETSVLDAMVDAAEAIQVAEIHQQHPDRVDSIEQVSEETLAAAREVAAQAKEAVRRACHAGVVLALPALPGHPPPRDAPAEDLAAFEDRTLQLVSLAALSGAPQVVIPVVAKGSPPLAVSLIGLHKSDMRLLQTAGKLGPLMNRMVSSLGLQPPPSGCKAAAAAGPRNGKAASKQASGSKASSPGPSNPAQAAAASAPDAPGTAAKDRGNALFKAGKYAEAVHAYTEAIEADQRNPVFRSNRAMAALKMMEFAQAEEDCNVALRLEAPVKNPKTLLRRGTARLGLGRLSAARADFQLVLNLEPSNRQAREELKALEGVDESMFGDQSGSMNGLMA